VVGIIDEVGAGVSDGRKESGLASAGTAVTTIRVANASAAIFVTAGVESSGIKL